MSLNAKLLLIAALILLGGVAWQFYTGQEASEEELSDGPVAETADVPKGLELLGDRRMACPHRSFVKDNYCNDCQLTTDENGDLTQEAIGQALNFNKWIWQSVYRDQRRKWTSHDNIIVFHNPKDKDASKNDEIDIFGVKGHGGGIDKNGECHHGEHKKYKDSTGAPRGPFHKPVVRCTRGDTPVCKLLGEKCITYHVPNNDKKKWARVKKIKCQDKSGTEHDISFNLEAGTEICPNDYFMEKHYCEHCMLTLDDLGNLTQDTVDKAWDYSFTNSPRFKGVRKNTVVLHNDGVTDPYDIWGPMTMKGNRDPKNPRFCTHSNNWKPVLQCQEHPKSCVMSLMDLVSGHPVPSERCITNHDGIHLHHYITCRLQDGTISTFKFY